MTTTVLFSASPLSPRRVDDHFAREAEAVRDLGAGVATVDDDLRVRGEVAARVYYRGWMMPATRYARLAERVGGAMVTPAAAYRSAHELPGWYAAFADLTPLSVWTDGVPDAAALAGSVAPLGAGAAIVKDYVKSRKHEWSTACFVPDLSDISSVERVVGEMVRLQGEDLNGGVVVRRFETFAPAPGEPAEVRVWWHDGEAVLVSPHPDSPGGAIPAIDLAAVAAGVRRLGAPFVTTDLARGPNGWRVVEVGDAQVSDLHRDVDPASLWRPVLSAGGDRVAT